MNLLEQFNKLIIKNAEISDIDLFNYGKILESNGFPSLRLLGQGDYSAAFLTDFGGKEVVAKVTKHYKEYEIADKFKQIRDKLPEKYKKHLPEIIKLIKIPSDNLSGKNLFITIVEKLNPLNSNVLKLMFGQDSYDYRSYTSDFLDMNVYKHFKDENWLHKLIYECLSYYNLEKYIKLNGIKYILKTTTDIIKNYDFSDLFYHTISEKFLKLKRKLLDNALIIADEYENSKMISGHIKSFIDRLVSNLTTLVETPRNYGTVPVEYSSSGDKQTLSKINYETKSLMEFLNYLSDNFGIQWGDLHWKNIMERPGTRDIVVADFGNFEYEE